MNLLAQASYWSANAFLEINYMETNEKIFDI